MGSADTGEKVLMAKKFALCPGCDAELREGAEEEEEICGECGMHVCHEKEDYPENIVWHPKRKF